MVEDIVQPTEHEVALEESKGILHAYNEFVARDYSEIPPNERAAAIEDDYIAIHQMIFEGRKPNEKFNTGALQELVPRESLNLKPVYDMMKKIMVPGSANIPLFQGCGAFLVARRDGSMIGFDEVKTGGSVYQLMGDTCPYLLAKMAALEALQKLGYEPSLALNSDKICELLGMNEGDYHMGGYIANIPSGTDGTRESVMMGLSAIEITHAALESFFMALTHEKSKDPYPTDKDRENLPDNLKHMEYGFFTAAGFFDEVAGMVAEATLNGATAQECQAIVDREWNTLLALEKKQPLPGQYN